MEQNRNRLKDWISFSVKVHSHIISYANPQYSNPDGDEQIDHYTAQQCVDQIKRYTARFGRGARGREEELRDLLKIAHYAQFAYDKLDTENKEH